jgi:hypothetical protein
MMKLSLWALLTFCAALMVLCLAGCWWATRENDWGSFAVLSVCATICGYMVGGVGVWLREEYRR